MKKRFILFILLFFILLSCEKPKTSILYPHVEISGFIISNKSSEEINITFPYLQIRNININTNNYHKQFIDGPIFQQPRSPKEVIEYYYNNFQETLIPAHFKINDIYFESNRVNFKITNLNVFIENSHFITNNNFEEMKKYLNTQGSYRIYEDYYTGRFLLVILTIDDSTLTNTYWGTTNE